VRWRLNAFWDWFWYFRRGKIRYRVWEQGDTCKAMASNGKLAVWNCYGSTPEQAKAMAAYRLEKAIDEEQKVVKEK